MKKKLDNYINNIKTLEQKSKEWYAIRPFTIGGSEIATIIGRNPFNTIKSLVAEKSGIKESFKGNINTRWGCLFEQVTREWTQLTLLIKDKIIEIGSIEGIIPGQRYSPDGLGIVQLYDENDNIIYFMVLFEFKSPLKSIPDGSIPKHYIPQIQTGLLTIPITEVGIFVNNCYRKCALNDIGFNMTYDNIFHSGDITKKLTKKQKIEEVFACGIICFYQTIEYYKLALSILGYDSDSEDLEDNIIDNTILYDFEYNQSSEKYADIYDSNILIETRENIIDFGIKKEPLLNRLLELLQENRVCAIYYPMILNQSSINNLEFIQTHKKEKNISNVKPTEIVNSYIQEFFQQCENNKTYPIGILPWKLVKSDIIAEMPDEKWKEIIETPIKEVLGIINNIVSSNNPKHIYNKHFPETIFDDINEEDSNVIYESAINMDNPFKNNIDDSD